MEKGKMNTQATINLPEMATIYGQEYYVSYFHSANPLIAIDVPHRVVYVSYVNQDIALKLIKQAEKCFNKTIDDKVN